MRAFLGSLLFGAAGVGIVCWVGLTFFMPGRQHAQGVGCATCAQARKVHGWCDACAVGYVAGLPIKSRLLYDTMDAHGHQLQVDRMPCEGCRRLAKTGGFCDANHIGWRNGEAYFSRLTYELSGAYYMAPSQIACRTCRDNADGAGWCDACGYGMIGRFAIASRADFDAGRRGFERLQKAIELSARCDYCAMAMVTDTDCFRCKTVFKDGELVASGAASTSAGN
ncbi:MAG: hypothetical protein KDA33_12770 [Phycisphaerales bacterium]|nr:hypothetical protein [Phycisphaerales bacterium]